MSDKLDKSQADDERPSKESDKLVKADFDILKVITFKFLNSSEAALIGFLSGVDKNKDPMLKVPARLKNGVLCYNPKLLLELGKDAEAQIFGQIMHLALMHPRRRRLIAFDELQKKIADLAADLAIYHQITQSQRFPRPEQFGFPQGKCFEEYYRLLMSASSPEKIQKTVQQHTGTNSKGEPAKTNVPKAEQWVPQDNSMWDGVPDDVQLQQQSVLNQFAQQQKGSGRQKGDLSSGIARLVRALPKSIITWEEHLRRIIGTNLSSNEYYRTIKRPSRRHSSDSNRSNDVVTVKGKKELGKGNICISADTSGSIQSKELKQFLGETLQIAKVFNAPLRFIACDMQVWADLIVKTVHDVEMLKYKVKGGGGTSSIPVFKALEGTNTQMLIFFTDLATDFPEEAPPYRVLWVVPPDCQHHEPPFGEVLEMKDMIIEDPTDNEDLRDANDNS